MTQEEKRKENALRKKAKQQGYIISKSRGAENFDNQGGYRITCAATNTIEAGERLELSLEDVERFLNE